MNDAESHHFLAFDLGAESGRSLLGSLRNGQLSVRETNRFLNLPVRQSGHMHWDIHALFDQIKRSISLCAAEIPRGPASIGIDTWGVDFALLDQDGRVLGLPFCYRDQRTEGAMDEYFRLVPREELYEQTGIQFMPFNTLFQIYSMVRDKSPLLDSAANLLFMPDLFNYLLTGVKTSEYTIASTSQFLDPRTREWNERLFQVMGLSTDMLPDIVAPGTVLGPVLEENARQTGIANVPVVATASHDTAGAVAAVPAEGKDWAYISSGTWSIVGIEETTPVITSDSLECNFTNEGGIAGSIRFLKNVTGLWLVQQCRKSWEAEHRYDYEELTAMAGEASPFEFLIDPDHPDFLNPSDMPEAISEYCRKTSQKTPSSKASTIRSILESLALKYRSVVDQLRRVSGKSISRLYIIGGGAKNKLLCQFTANATGLPVSSGPVEATAIGNTLVQAMALGHVSSPAEMREIIRNSFELERFEPGQEQDWREAYERFKTISHA